MQPLLAISSLSLGSCEHHSLFSKLQAAARAGFSAVDLFDTDWEHFKREYAQAHSLPPSTIDGDPTSVAAARAISHICTTLRLRLLCLQPFREFEARKDPKEAADRLRRAKGTVDILPILGTDMLLIPSTTLPASQLDSSPERMAADLAALADYAASFSPPLRICYEALSWGTHVSTWRAAWDVVALADRPNLGLCLDSFNTAARQWADPYSPSGTLLPLPAINAALTQNLAELVALVPPHKIFYFQLADGQRMLIPLTLPEDPTVPPLRPWSRSYRLFPMETARGAYLPVREFADAVKRTGYQGPWSLEIFNDSLADAREEVPAEHATRGMEGLNKVLGAVGLAETTTSMPALESKESTSSTNLKLKLTRPNLYRGLLIFPAVASLLFILFNTLLPFSNPSFPRMSF